jgi:hypothetical protein
MNIPISQSDNTTTIMMKMANGNPDAMLVLLQLLAKSMLSIFAAEEMGLRGAALCVAYEEYAYRNIDVLIQGLKTNDPMLTAIIKFTEGDKP